MEGLPGLERRNWRSRVDRRELWYRRVLEQHDALELRKSCALQQPAPRERSGLLEFGYPHWIISLLGIALLGGGPARLGNLGLESEAGGRQILWRVPADHPQHLRDIGAIGRLLVGELRA